MNSFNNVNLYLFCILFDMTYIKTGTRKLRRSITFKNWRRNISGKEKWQAQVMKKKILLADD